MKELILRERIDSKLNAIIRLKKNENGNISNSTVRPVSNVASSPDKRVELLPVTKSEVFNVARKEAKAFSNAEIC